MKDEKLDVYVYGLSYEHQEIEEPLYDAARPRSREKDCISFWHTEEMPQHIPMNVKGRVQQQDLTTLPLGHIHKPEILLRDKAAYAGALEPIDRE